MSFDPSLSSVALVPDCNRRASEMEVTMVGLQNAGKTSLLRVLAVSLASALHCISLTIPREESSLSSKCRRGLRPSAPSINLPLTPDLV